MIPLCVKGLFRGAFEPARLVAGVGLLDAGIPLVWPSPSQASNANASSVAPAVPRRSVAVTNRYPGPPRKRG
jgi:hypothetical protein